MSNRNYKWSFLEVFPIRHKYQFCWTAQRAYWAFSSQIDVSWFLWGESTFYPHQSYGSVPVLPRRPPHFFQGWHMEIFRQFRCQFCGLGFVKLIEPSEGVSVHWHPEMIVSVIPVTLSSRLDRLPEISSCDHGNSGNECAYLTSV